MELHSRTKNKDILRGGGKYKGLTELYQKILEGGELPNDLYKYGLIFLGPDAFYQNEVMNIFHFLVSKGFIIIDIRFLRKLTRGEMETIFLPDSTCMNCGKLKWWMIEDIAKLGVFAEVIIYFPIATTKKSCLNFLNEMKGKSNPFLNNKATIRGNENVVNELFNLVHIPDDYCDFIKDSIPFYSYEELINIIKRCEQNTLKERGEICLDEKKLFEIEFHSKKRLENKSVFKSMYYLKYELLSIFSSYDENVDQLLAMVIDYLKFLRGEKDRILCLKKMRVLNKLENELIDRIRARLDAVLVKCKINDKSFQSLIGDYQILFYFYILSNENEFCKVSEKMMMDLTNIGIDIDEFDKHIILSSCLQWDTKGI